MAQKEQSGINWKAMKSWIVGITSVIVVIPALVNAGLDVYNALMKIPRTVAEKNNVELFRKHMGQKPLVEVPLPVRLGAATYDANFSIYEGGDVYVKYGNTTQWFPFPETERTNTSSFNLLSSAYADETTVQAAMDYKQMESIDGDYLIRKKQYTDGMLEQEVIDMRSGEIVQTIKEKAGAAEASPSEAWTPPPSPAPTQATPRKQVIAPFAVIDLNRVQQTTTSQATATTCNTPQGNCTLLRAMPLGSDCTCPSTKGEIKGKAK